MLRKIVNNKMVMLPVMMALLSLVLIVFGSSILITPKRFQFEKLDSGWTVSRDGVLLPSGRLSDINLGYTRRGETISLSTTIHCAKIVAPTLMFKTGYAVADVYCDGVNIYSYGHEYYDKGKYVPKRYHLVALEEGRDSYDIVIDLKMAEDGAVKGIYAGYFGSRNDLIKNFIQHKRLAIFIGGFLGMYACLLFSLGAYLFLYHGKRFSIIYSAATAFLFGFYTYAYNDIFWLISDHDYFFSVAEYVALYFVPVSISLLFYLTIPDIAVYWQRIILAINIIMPFVLISLHVLNIAHIQKYVLVVQTIEVVEIVVLFLSTFRGVIKRQKNKRESPTYTGINSDDYLLFGGFLILIFALLEIFKFYYLQGTGKVQGFLKDINFLSLGALYFTFCLFMYYFFHGIENSNAEYVKEQLEGLAYTDSLTGLVNRAKCMQYTSTVKDDYAIVSIDLDRLKYVNDNYGHTTGDEMIKSFADILKKAFVKADMIGRTGGDEFIVVFQSPDKDSCDKAVNELEKMMKEFNEGERMYKLSASYGYAYSGEADNASFDDIFYIADSRMYEMKETHHA